MKKKTDIKACFILALLLCALPGWASAQDVKDYTIMKGDTLWDISGKELQDPFLWPKIWKENPEIKNPDRVYPGQEIRIPLYVIQPVRPDDSSASARTDGQEKPAVTTPPADKDTGKKADTGKMLKPLVDPGVLMASGYIAESIATVGTVTGSPDDRMVFGLRDPIYVKTTRPVTIGERFYVVRAENPVRHPLTDRHMGYIVEVLAIAEIKEFAFGETRAQIIQGFVDVVTGDQLLPYYELTPPLTTGQHRKPNINATVVAAKGLQMLNGNLDIVYIDKGERDGLEIGDLLRTVSVGTHKIPNGIIQIINQQETTATAIVKEFSDTVSVGNWVTRLD